MREIEVARRGEVVPPKKGRGRDEGGQITESSIPQQTEEQLTKQSDSEVLQRPQKLTSRPKTKCYFGPRTKRGREKRRTSPTRRDPPPPPPLSRKHVPLELDGLGTAPLCDKRRYGHPIADRICTDQEQDRTHYEKRTIGEVDDQVLLPSRPTLLHFTPARRPLFSKYLGIPPATPRPPPSRSIPERLGLTEAEFDTIIFAEIDEVLLASADERRRARETKTSASETSQTLQILSKDDCLAYFRTHGYPTFGSLLGVYWWAANMGYSRFDYESDIDWNDLSFLDAYE